MIANAIQEINHYQVDIKVGFVNTYPLDGGFLHFFQLVLYNLQELDYFI